MISVFFLVTFSENTDRVLVVALMCISICLLLTVILLIVHYETERCKQRKKLKSKLLRSASGTNQDGTDPTESASLLGTDRSPDGESSDQRGEEGDYYSTNSSEETIHPAAEVIHEHYPHSLAGQLKSSSRLHSNSRFRDCLNKWCSCCCTNAPWQRELEYGDYRIAHPHESQGQLNDDVTSIDDHDLVRSTLTHSSPGSFPVPRTTALEPDNASVYEFTDDVAASGDAGSADDHLIGSATSHHGSSLHQHSEDHHFSDVSSIQQAASSKQSSNLFQSSTPVQNHRSQQSYQSSFSSHSTETTTRQTSHHSRDLPPFPKPMSTSFRPSTGTAMPSVPTPLSPRSVGNDPMHYGGMTVMQQHHHSYTASIEGTRHSHFVYPSRVILRQKSTQIHHHHDHIPHSSTVVHPRFNSLHPPSYRTHVSNYGTATDKRDSFYDNSLPRDSPLLTYYTQHNHHQRHRPELPGTRNLNQYY